MYTRTLIDMLALSDTHTLPHTQTLISIHILPLTHTHKLCLSCIHNLSGTHTHSLRHTYLSGTHTPILSSHPHLCLL